MESRREVRYEATSLESRGRNACLPILMLVAGGLSDGTCSSGVEQSRKVARLRGSSVGQTLIHDELDDALMICRPVINPSAESPNAHWRRSRLWKPAVSSRPCFAAYANSAARQVFKPLKTLLLPTHHESFLMEILSVSLRRRSPIGAHLLRSSEPEKGKPTRKPHTESSVDFSGIPMFKHQGTRGKKCKRKTAPRHAVRARDRKGGLIVVGGT
ncbi:hypothetical protein QBC35DRAFT_154068 [Podospora australis]|uniref:Uncharacterized protein n=1 Tax=Podospora australis TaxID=1536484 RepID=A0AAN6WZA4_9PEZI|nr:hypothetical protein QBC35DRAFT_154068 [Podospora australis]